MNRFLFIQQIGAGATDIFSSDGTAAGTVDLDLSRFGYSSDELPIDFINFDNRSIFMGTGPVGLAADEQVAGGVGYTDGTEAGTSFQILTGGVGSFIPEDDAVVNGHLLVSGSTELNDAQGPKEIFSSTDGINFTSIETGVGLPYSGDPNLVSSFGIVTSGNVGYFAGSVYLGDGPEDGALWRTDGTAAGTYQVVSGSTSPLPTDIMAIGGNAVVFVNQDPAATAPLWTSNGTADQDHGITGTGLQSVYTSTQGASTGTRAIFAGLGTDGTIGVWSSDGTAAGTVQIESNGPLGPTTLIPDDFVRFGNKVLFDNGYSLFVTDGTAAGTKLLPSGASEDITVAGNKAYFFAPEAFGPAIGVTDGTVAGTARIGINFQSFDADLTAVGNQVVFTGMDAAGNAALFGSDGTIAGTGELTLPAGVPVPATGGIASLPVIVAKPTPPKPTPPPPTPPIVTLDPGDQVYKASAGQAVIAGSGNDTVIASAGDVTVTGSGGHLTFFGGTGASSVFGGDGSSLIFGGAGGGHFIGGTAGGNILVSQGATGGNTTLTGAGAGDQIFGSATGNDVLIAGAGQESVLGGGGPTTIQGGAAADVIFTGLGATQVYGGSGAADTVVAGSGAVNVTANAGDAIFGNAGRLSVTGSRTGADSIVGGAGGLAVTGTGGNMLVVAGAGASRIATGNGASLIFEGSGASTVTGGAGSMEVVLGSGKASVTDGTGPTSFEIVSGAAGGADMLSGFKVGTDSISLFGYTAAQTSISVVSGNTLIALSDGTKITVIGVTDLGTSLIG